MKILIVGDSHVGGLRGGYKQVKTKIPVDFDLRLLGNSKVLAGPFYEARGDHVAVTDPHYLERHQRAPDQTLSRIPPEDISFDAIGLSMPLYPLRLMQRLLLEGWRFGPVIPGQKRMSDSLLRQLVLADLRYISDLITFLRRAEHRVFAISAPGVFSHNVLIQRGNVTAAELVDAFGAYNHHALAELERLGCDAILPPPSVFGEDGVMLDKYKHPDREDFHHANEAFGEKMLWQIAKWAKAEVPVTA